jgi:hypothetical protein
LLDITKGTRKYLDSRLIVGFRTWGFRPLIWAVLAVVACGIGLTLANLNISRLSVFLVGIVVVGIPATLYLMRGVSYEKAFVLMVLTLPLLYGLVLNIGGNFRITYVFTVLAFVLGLTQGKLRTFPKEPAVLFLSAFVIYAVFSTALTFGIDTSGPKEAAGFRLSSLRSVIQAGQLLLMVMAFYVTINYVTSFERLRRFSNLVFWSTAAVTLYGGYDFFAALFDLPFFSVIYDLSYYAGGRDSPYFSVGGVSIPRPRSTLGEPLDLSIFLLFGIPYSIALLASERSASLRAVKICFILLGCILFIVSNSRASLLAIPVIFALMFWLAPSYVARLKMLLAGAVVYLVVALAIFPLAGGNGDVLSPIRFFAERMASLQNIGANLRGDLAGTSIGRGYNLPFSVFREHPVFGVGLGNYPFYYSELVGSPIIILATTFSLYFRLLTELGIIGTAIFLLFVSTALWRLLRVIKLSSDRMLRPFAVAALISIVGVMIARVGLDGLYTDSYIWVMLGVGVAIPWLANRGQESAVPKQRLATDPDIPAALIGRQVGIPSEPEGAK